MAQLEVNFTIKGELSETTLYLIEEGDKFILKGCSSESGEHQYNIQKNDVTSIFQLSARGVFEESEDIIEERLVGLSEEWVDFQSQGLESDSGNEHIIKKPGYGPKDIIVEPKSFALEYLITLIEKKNIEISPRFQRNFVWDNTRKSRLIESIFLGLPLPAIYLSQYDDGRLTIVDGLQRIRTILDFYNDKFPLCNMEYFENCNGKKYTELNLTPLQKSLFEQTPIRCFIIDYRSPRQLKYDLFRRLNTGGKVLNDQEIRNCLSKEHLQDTLEKMISSEEFGLATDHKVKDTRMAAKESALKFIYFYQQYSVNNPTGKYDGDMRSSLDSAVEHLNKKTKEELEEYVVLFRKSMKRAFDLFGDYCFRKVFSGYRSSRRSPINKSLMLAISVLLAVRDNEVEKTKNNICMTDKLATLLDTDDRLRFAISWSTSSKNNIEYLFYCLNNKLFCNL